MSDALSIEQGIVHLPSRGQLYLGEEGQPIFPEGIVQLRPMTTREEQLLTSVRTRTSRDQVMYSLVSKCLVKEDAAKMPFDRYLLGDVLYMLMVLRSVTWGPEYVFEIKCGECDRKSMVEVKIPEDLRVFVFGEEEKDHTFSVDLPKAGVKVEMRLLRVGDEKEISEYARRKGKDQSQCFPFRLSRHVVKWGGEKVKPVVLKGNILDLHALDTEALRDGISDADCGIDLLLKRECPKCGEDIDVNFEFTSDFFCSKSSALRRRRRAAGGSGVAASEGWDADGGLDAPESTPPSDTDGGSEQPVGGGASEGS